MDCEHSLTRDSSSEFDYVVLETQTPGPKRKSDEFQQYQPDRERFLLSLVRSVRLLITRVVAWMAHHFNFRIEGQENEMLLSQLPGAWNPPYSTITKPFDGRLIQQQAPNYLQTQSGQASVPWEEEALLRPKQREILADLQARHFFEQTELANSAAPATRVMRVIAPKLTQTHCISAPMSQSPAIKTKVWQYKWGIRLAGSLALRNADGGTQRRAEAFSTPPSQSTRDDIKDLDNGIERLGQYLEEELRFESKAQESRHNRKPTKSDKLTVSSAPATAKSKRIVGRLAPDWEEAIEQALKITDSSSFVDPRDRITRRDLGMLLPPLNSGVVEGWLNDEVVNEYLTLVMEEQHRQQGYIKKRGMVPRVYVFNSQFQSSYKQRGNQGVSRWAIRGEIDGDKLMQVDEILIPICKHSHWTLLAISGTQKTIRYYNSFGSIDHTDIDMAKNWLEGQLGSAYTEEKWVLSDGGSNQQQNAKDCGVFTALNAHALMIGETPREVLPAKDAARGRKWMAATLLGRKL